MMLKKKRKLTTGSALAASALAAVMGLAVLAPTTVVSRAEDAVITSDSCYEEGYNVSVDIGAEGSVLLKNSNNVLPLSESAKVTVLGSMSYNYVQGGTGSAGGKDDENTVMLDAALEEAGLDVNATAWDWLENECGGSRMKGTDANGVSWDSYTAIHEFPIETYEDGKSSIITDGYTDYAIVTISRSGAEGASPSMDYDEDGSTLTGTTYLELNDDEKDLLKFCKENFKHTIVLINSASAMELGFIDSTDYNVDACLWIGHPGEAGITGAATILSGRANPSGALVDTYGYDMSTNPTYYNTDGNSYTNKQTYYQYEEGIYVGYRYYETADAEGYFDSEEFTSHEFKNRRASGYDEVVQFPFGYGLSYSTFTQEIMGSDINLQAGSTNSVTVKVTNSASSAYSGKDVVQLYMEAPYNVDSSCGIAGKGLEKSKVVLVGYAKTGDIKPGESEEVTITFETDNLASFDNFGNGCYVLEKGDYYFNVQDNAHTWAREDGASNKVYDFKQVTLDNSIIYNETGAGKRSSDAIVAVNAMDDVTAGDGNMLDGYLSRSDFAAGMTSIMSHESNSKEIEVLKEEIAACLALTGTNSLEYSYQTYINGVKTTKTSTIYAKGANMMPFATETPDGLQVSSLTTPVWGQTYYVAEDENGDVILDDEGYFEVLTTAPSGAHHKLSCDDMTNIPINTEKGKALWTKLAEMTTMAEAIQVQGASGWKTLKVESVGKEEQKTVDGPGEPANGTENGLTWFPCAVTIASTWSNDIAKRQGISYGNQCVLVGVGGSYSPAMNIHRSPFGGRNFEYYSEDGFISGHIGGNVVEGIMSTGTNVFIKHFALNDGDTNRSGNTTWANEQAIREIYLYTYEIACKTYGANGIMGSLNRIGMTWYHYGMYNTVLRKEWAWNGFLITDGDGSDGDSYNSPQAMLSIGGSMLHVGCYINTASTVAAYGDATQTVYGQYMLQQNMIYNLYQYCGGGIGITQSSSDIPLGLILGIIGGVVGVVAIGVVVGVVVSKKKKVAKKA